MSKSIAWHEEIAKVVGCARCSSSTDRNLLRDDVENVPQPGYVGPNYWCTRVLVVGRNPGTPKSLAVEDRPYTAALRALRDEPTEERFAHLTRVMEGFMPQWHYLRSFPFVDCGLKVTDIAYCNVVLGQSEKVFEPVEGANEFISVGNEFTKPGLRELF